VRARRLKRRSRMRSPMSDNAYKVVIAKVIVRRAIMAAAT